MYPCDFTGHEFVTSKINPDEELCVHCFITRLKKEEMNIDNAPEKSATDQLREARHNARRVRDFKEIHVSADFLLRLEACEDFEDIVGNKVINKTYPNDLFGFPYVVHREKTDAEFWFVDEYGMKI